MSVDRSDASPDLVPQGRALYHEHCMRCHGLAAASSGLYPDLRHTSRAVHDQWNDVVLGGTRAAGGMASFADVIDAKEAQAIRAYVVSRALHEPTLLQQVAQYAVELGLCAPPSWVTD